MLVMNGWQGDEAAMGHFLDAFEGFALEEYRQVFNGKSIVFTDAQVSMTESMEIDVSEGQASALIGAWLNVSTPGVLCPAKARLLRKLRIICPQKQP